MQPPGKRVGVKPVPAAVLGLRQAAGLPILNVVFPTFCYCHMVHPRAKARGCQFIRQYDNVEALKQYEVLAFDAKMIRERKKQRQ